MQSILLLLKLSDTYRPFLIFFLIFIFLSTSLLEMLGIGMLMPFVLFLLDENSISTIKNTPYTAYIPNFFFELSFNQLLLFFSFSIFTLFVLKHLFLTFSIHLITTFVGKLKANLSNKLMINYIKQNYIYHSTKKNSEINFNINQKVDTATNSSVSSLLYIISDLLVIIGVIILIYVLDQMAALYLVAFYLFIGFVILKLLSKKLKNFGEKRQIEQLKKFNSFSALINNIREIILTGKKNFALKDFSESQIKLSTLDARFNTIQRIPYSVFEIIGLLSLFTIVFYLKNDNYNSEKIIAICTLFAAISYRVIPSLNKITFYYYQIKYSQKNLLTIIEELKLKQKIKFHDKKIIFKKAINLKNIFFEFKKNRPIIKNINFKIKKNSMVGIIGSSGSGKTTLLDIISGLLFPTKGIYSIDNIKINNNYLARKVQNIVSYASQRCTLLNATLKENICFGVDYKSIDNNKYEEVIKISMLKNFSDKINKDLELNEFGKNISGGQLQRIGIARALYFDREIVILDEATSALDSQTENKIFENLNKMKLKKTIIIVSHRLRNLRYCDKIYEITNGSIKILKK